MQGQPGQATGQAARHGRARGKLGKDAGRDPSPEAARCAPGAGDGSARCGAAGKDTQRERQAEGLGGCALPDPGCEGFLSC